MGMLSSRTKARGFAVGVMLAALAVLPVRAQSLQERLPTCFACHGEKGQSQLPEVPSLGAQQAVYTLIELVMFRDKLRITEPMNEMTKGLSDDELRTASEIITKSPAPEPVSDTGDTLPARREGACSRSRTAATSAINISMPMRQQGGGTTCALLQRVF